MWLENAVLKKDLDALCASPFIPWDALQGMNVFVTGATGLIGSSLVNALLYYEKTHRIGLQVRALVRDIPRAEVFFAAQLRDGCALEFAEGSVESLPLCEQEADYIIHCACPTDSAYFVSHPVDTVDSIVSGTKNILELARRQKARGVVYLSSMEVYGEIGERRLLSEKDVGYMDPLAPRNSYPMGKRMAEALCCAYFRQYGVPVTIARLAQTFGPGVKREDRRVFAYMARCALAGEDILLNTDGTKENMYLYTADAVSALLLLLLKGERGAAYNAANEETYCSVREMGEIALKTLSAGSGAVRTNVSPEKASIYPANSFMLLDVSRLKALGWRPLTALDGMYRKMAGGFCEQ